MTEVEPLLNKQFQISYNEIVVTSKDKRVILNGLTGCLPTSRVCAIIGPSGSGKTTLLNFLSGRLQTSTLEASGHLFFNSHPVTSVSNFSREIAYVTQQELLLPALTVRQTIRFATDLRLNRSTQQKRGRVEELIETLGLQSCADTKIGNNIIKGVSGGQKRRTSIAVELIVGPGVIFLDEPTTGLDSASALAVVQLLSDLAKNTGMSVVCTLHQPSRDIYELVDHLTLIAKGNIVFQGQRNNAAKHFSQIGRPVPSLCDELEHFVDTMSKKQNEQEFDAVCEQLRKGYEKSQYCVIRPAVYEEVVPRNVSVGTMSQLWFIFYRAMLSQVRNPMDVALKIASGVLFGLAAFLVYSKVDGTIQSVRDRQGFFFFISSNIGFGGIQNSLPILIVERINFVKQRFSKMYGVMPYMVARMLAALVFDVIYPLVPMSITYFYLGLDNSDGRFFYALIACEAMYFSASGFGLFFSTLVKSLETASALIPVLIVPMFLASGFYRNANELPWMFWPIKQVSVFRYCYQALMFNQFTNNPTIPVDYNPLKAADFWPGSYWGNIWFMVAEGLVLRALSIASMAFLSTPKTLELVKGDFKKSFVG